jgi:hypothetical protein
MHFHLRQLLVAPLAKAVVLLAFLSCVVVQGKSLITGRDGTPPLIGMDDTTAETVADLDLANVLSIGRLVS